MQTQEQKDQLQSSKAINAIKLDLCNQKGSRSQKYKALYLMCENHKKKYGTDLFPKTIFINGYRISFNSLFKEWIVREPETGAGEDFKDFSAAIDHAERG